MSQYENLLLNSNFIIYSTIYLILVLQGFEFLPLKETYVIQVYKWYIILYLSSDVLVLCPVFPGFMYQSDQFSEQENGTRRSRRNTWRISKFKGQTLWNKPGFIHGQTYILEALVTGLLSDYSQKLTII